MVHEMLVGAMATTFCLIRHAEPHGAGGILRGRAAGVHLSARGRLQAQGLVAALARFPIRAIYSSPLERAVETATPLAEHLGLDIVTSRLLEEIDFGEWTGCGFDELRSSPQWQLWNAQRSRARVPGGESMAEVQERIARKLERLAALHPEAHVALFSHGDVIKAAVCHVLGLGLDAVLRFEVALASITVVAFTDSGARLLELNTPDVPSGS